MATHKKIERSANYNWLGFITTTSPTEQTQKVATSEDATCLKQQLAEYIQFFKKEPVLSNPMYDILVYQEKHGLYLVTWAILDQIPYSHKEEHLMEFTEKLQGTHWAGHKHVALSQIVPDYNLQMKVVVLPELVYTRHYSDNELTTEAKVPTRKMDIFP